MNEIVEFHSFRDRALSTLEAARTALELVSPADCFSWHFRLSNMGDVDAVQSLFDEVKRTINFDAAAIYCFELADVAAYSLLHDKYVNRPTSQQQTGQTLCYSRLLNEPDPGAIYVGSSRKFPSRLSEHLGRTGGAKTYSMRLNLWAVDLPTDVRLTVWLFDPRIDSGVLELLEQALWDTKRPMLGKRSGK